jgi:hypothetical protein
MYLRRINLIEKHEVEELSYKDNILRLYFMDKSQKQIEDYIEKITSDLKSQDHKTDIKILK